MSKANTGQLSRLMEQIKACEETAVLLKSSTDSLILLFQNFDLAGKDSVNSLGVEGSGGFAVGGTVGPCKSFLSAK
eukprot:1158149-Pelagomonas_calceolata.AAC.3